MSPEAKDIVQLKRAVELTRRQLRKALHKPADCHAWAWATSLTETTLRDYASRYINRSTAAA